MSRAAVLSRVLVLLGAVLLCSLLASAQWQEPGYYFLPDNLKRYVDQAIAAGNRQLNHGHLNYDKIGKTAQTSETYVRIDVRLRATTCKKVSSGDAKHRPGCPFKKLPEVRCMVCGECPENHQPFINCVCRKDENDQLYALSNKHCEKPPSSLISYSYCVKGARGEPGPPPGRDPPGLGTISVWPSTEGVSGGRQVIRGSVFTIGCYHPWWLIENTTFVPEGSYYLTFDSGSNVTHSYAPSFFRHNKNVADFQFPAADHTHQGVYRCGHGIVVDGHAHGEQWQSEETLSLSVVITEHTPVVRVYPSITGVPEEKRRPWQRGWRPERRREERLQVMVQEGSVFSVSCHIHPPHHPNSSFRLLAAGSTPGTTQPCVNGSTHFQFPVADRRAHQGDYACVYEVVADGGHVYTRLSEISLKVTNLTLAIAVLNSSSIDRVSEGRRQGQDQVSLEKGSMFTIRCSIQEEQHPNTSFYLEFSSGSNSHSQPCASDGSALFLIPVARHAHRGDYTCVHRLTADGYVFTRRSATLSLAIRESSERPRGRPSIGVYPSLGRSGSPEVLDGFSFTVTCSVQGPCVGSLFNLTIHAQDRKNVQKPCVDGSASFEFPTADRSSHHGVYRCLYGFTDVGGTTSSAWSDPLFLAVTTPSADSFRDYDYVPDQSDN